MPFLYVLSGIISETEECITNSDSYNIIQFKDMEMISYYHNLGYIVYLVIYIPDSNLRDFDFRWFEFDLTKDDVQNFLNLCCHKDIKIYKYGTDYE